MPTKAKKSASKPKAAPRKRATHERALKNRPVDPEAAEQEQKKSAEPTGDEELLKTPANAAKRKPRQGRLPGTEDPEIEELESAAEDYAEVRDKRMALTTDEVELKEELLKLMHAHDKTRYFHAGIEIRVVAKDETVKVKIAKDKD